MSGFILSYPIGNAKSKNTKNYTSLSEMKSDKSIPDGTVGSVSEYGWVTMKEAKALKKVVDVPKLKDTGLAEDEIQYIDTNHLDFESCSLMIYYELGLGDPIYLFKSKEGDKVYLWYLETFFSRNRLGIGLKKVLANSTPLKKYETTLLILVNGINSAAMENGMLEFNNAAAQQKDSKWFTLLFNELLKRMELSLWLDDHDLIYPKSDDLLKEYEEEAKLELIDSGIENVFRVPGLKNSTLYIKENGLWTNICNTHTYEDEETLLSSSAQNGDIGVTNNGTYIRANGKWKDIDSYKKVTWQELKDLRDGGNLNPGSLYRITDYQCTTTQENTQSAGHQFDIVLLALSENKLAEEGWAMEHPTDVYDVTFGDGVTKKCYIYVKANDDIYLVKLDDMLGYEGFGIDDFDEINQIEKTATITMFNSYEGGENVPYNYFQNSNLSAWKVWYCLDNDINRFSWADRHIDSTVVSINDGYQRNSTKDYTYNSTLYYAWYLDASNILFTLSENPQIGDNTYIKRKGGAMERASTVSSREVEGTGLPFGRGVVYRLIDEWNVDYPCDFKNMQMLIPMDSNDNIDMQNPVKYKYCYAFTDNTSGDPKDLSISGHAINIKVKPILTSEANSAMYFSPGTLFYTNHNVEQICKFSNVTVGIADNTIFINSGGSINILDGSNNIILKDCKNICMGYDSNDIMLDTIINSTFGSNCQTIKLTDEQNLNYGNNGAELATKNDLN